MDVHGFSTAMLAYWRMRAYGNFAVVSHATHWANFTITLHVVPARRPIQMEIPKMIKRVVHIFDPCADDAPSCCLLLLIGYDSHDQAISGCITEVVDQSQNLSHSLWTHFDWWQRPVPCQAPMNSPMHDFKSGNKLNAKLDAHFWRVFFEHLSAAISTGTYIFENRFGRAQVQLAGWCWLGLPVYFMYP